MATSKKPVAAPLPPVYNSITNCTITNTSAANEHTRAAIEALADAAKANAEAISAIAKGLTGSSAHMGSGITIGSNK